MGTGTKLKSYWERTCTSLRRIGRCLTWLLKGLVNLVFNRFVAVLLVLLCLCDLWLEVRGLPDCVCSRIEERLREEKIDLSFESIRLGVVSGVVVEGVRWNLATAAGPLDVSAGHVGLVPHWPEVLGGRPSFRRFRLASGGVCLRERPGGRQLEVSDVLLDCGMSLDGSLRGKLWCVFQGIELESSVELSGAAEGLRRLISEMKGDEAPVAVDPVLQRRVFSAGEKLSTVLTRGGGSRLRLDMAGAFSAPQAWTYRGYANLRNIQFQGLEIPRGSLSLSGTWKEIHVRDISVSLGFLNSIHGWLSLYPGAQEIEGLISGELSGLNALRIYKTLRSPGSGEDDLTGLAWIMRLPLKLRCRLRRSRPALGSLDLEASVSMAGLDLPVLGRCSGHVSGKLAKGHVILDDCRFSLDEDSAEHVSLAGEASLKGGRAGLRLQGALKLPSRLQRLGIELPAELVALDDAPCRFSMELGNSGASAVDWSASGTVTQEKVTLLGVPCSEAVVPFAYRDGRLSLEGIRAVMRGGKEPLLSGDIRCDLARMRRDGLCRIEFSGLTLHGERLKYSGGRMALNCSGRVDWHGDTSQLGFEVAGKVFPDRLYQNFLRRWDMDPSRMLMQISCRGSDVPMSFNLRMEPVSLTSGRWLLEGGFEFRKFIFNELPFKELACSGFSIGPESCSFDRIHGITGGGDELELNLRVDYAPLRLTFSRAVLTGDPRIVSKFFMSSGVRDTYLNVFKDFRWKADAMPTLRIPELVYQSNDGGAWAVTCEGIHLHARDVHYLGLHGDDFNTVVSLDLPHKVTMETGSLRKDGWWLGGKMELGLQGVKQCRFQIYDTHYGVDMAYLLKALAPSIWERLKNVGISGDCVASCRGSLFLDGEPRLRLDGTMRSKHVSYGAHRLNDVDMDWSYDGGHLGWQLKTAHYLGGLVRTSGTYDLGNNRGNLLLRFEGLPLDACYRQFAEDVKKPSQGEPKHFKGEVRGELNLGVLHGWAGRDWHFDGGGHLAIRKADLWNVPLLTALSKLFESAKLGWLTAGLGKITELDADLDLSGASVMVSRLQTNGTIMSLRGTGGYRWRDDWRKGKLHFLVRGIPVQEVKILSLLLSSVTGMFQAELTGTLQENHWKMRSFFDILF